MDRAIIFTVLFFGDGNPLFDDRIENVEVSGVFVWFCHVPLLGGEGKTETDIRVCSG